MKSILLALVSVGLLAAVLVTPAAAQGTEHAIDLFQFDGASGYVPEAGVITDRHGTIFGTTAIGGTGPCTGGAGCGTVFALAPPPGGGHSWLFSKLYDFQGGRDGSVPSAQLALGADGSLYGYTSGGTPGTVWQLLPPAVAGDPWQFDILFVFNGKTDGNLEDVVSPLIPYRDALYGIASGGASAACGQIGCGSVFRLLHRPGSAAWERQTLFAFTGPATEAQPTWLVGPDASGALYVSTEFGHGAIVQISPPATGGTWTETVLTRFAGGTDGVAPNNLVLENGTIYGLATVHRSGIAFQLAPPANGATAWTRTTLATIQYHGYGPASLAQGAAGTFIGVITGDVDFFPGSVFELTPPPVGGNWNVTELWNFNRGPDRNPLNVVTGKGGNLFGVLDGGDSTNGSVFELR